ADELGLTQSAISQALRRLRDVFGDRLFLRRPHGMEPTATALALEGPVSQAVEALRTALGQTRTFDPATASGVLRIAALDSHQSGIVPALAAQLRHLTPGLTLSVLPIGRTEAIEALVEGRIALFLGLLPDMPDTLRAEALYSETYLVAGRPDVLPLPLDLPAYAAAPHILVSPGGDLTGIVDVELQRWGLSRRIILGLPAFLPALAAAGSTGALVTLPARIARAFAPGFGLLTSEPPIPLRSFEVSAYWHRRNDGDPQLAWLVAQAKAVGGDATTG
ncbi:MAG TPA: LysR substrate-binding domain-containing protein, partial [Tabrizicola sp.]|nr:LysR substrate-binding domain-containing protein [Tabrizicola sp.]